MTEKGTDMTTERLPYLYADKDRHGNTRIYFWKGKGHTKVRVKERRGTPEFHVRYADLIAGKHTPSLKLAVVSDVKPQTFRWLCAEYFKSTDYRVHLKLKTQYMTRNELDACCHEPLRPNLDKSYADFPLRLMNLDALEVLRGRKSAKPNAANSRVKALRRLFKWAKESKIITQNIAAELKPLKVKSEGFHTWTVAELEQFERRHKLGTMARLSLDLLQFLGVSRMDVVMIGKGNVSGEVFQYRRGKTGVDGTLTMAPALIESLKAAGATDRETFLVSELGKPFTAGSFGNRFKEWCRDAGLPERCSAHGLRKAAATRAANNGATTHEMMAMLAWDTVKEAERYSRAFNRRKLGGKAATLLTR
jgi:integrase